MVSLDFSGTLARWPVFADAAVVTMVLSAAAMVLGLVIGVLGAAARMSRLARAAGDRPRATWNCFATRHS